MQSLKKEKAKFDVLICLNRIVDTSKKLYCDSLFLLILDEKISAQSFAKNKFGVIKLN